MIRQRRLAGLGASGCDQYCIAVVVVGLIDCLVAHRGWLIGLIGRHGRLHLG